jgi:hypothetical protein
MKFAQSEKSGGTREASTNDAKDDPGSGDALPGRGSGARPERTYCCPTNYTCSYQSSSTQALLGKSTDGQPQSRVGFLTFDGAGNWSGVLSGNLNGTVVSNGALSGTCVSGTDTTLGQLNFKAGLGGSPGTLAFVTAPNGTHTDLLLAGSMLASDTRIILAVCHGD